MYLSTLYEYYGPEVVVEVVVVTKGVVDGAVVVTVVVGACVVLVVVVLVLVVLVLVVVVVSVSYVTSLGGSAGVGILRVPRGPLVFFSSQGGHSVVSDDDG